MQIAIFLRFIFSWVDPTGRTGIGAFLNGVTEPILAPIRRVLPRTGMLDLSPFIVILVLGMLLRIVT